jgi:hypothetical protein
MKRPSPRNRMQWTCKSLRRVVNFTTLSAALVKHDKVACQVWCFDASINLRPQKMFAPRIVNWAQISTVNIEQGNGESLTFTSFVRRLSSRLRHGEEKLFCVSRKVCTHSKRTSLEASNLWLRINYFFTVWFTGMLEPKKVSPRDKKLQQSSQRASTFVKQMKANCGVCSHDEQ